MTDKRLSLKEAITEYVHDGMSVAKARLHTAVQRVIHENFADLLHEILRLAKVDELPLSRAASVVQGRQDGKGRAGAAGGIHVERGAGVAEVAIRVAA